VDLEEKITELEGEIYDLRFELQNSKLKEMTYLDILNNIQTSLNQVIKREEENKRFNLGDQTNFKQIIFNLKESLDEYKRVYKINF
jgi:UTP-glucose-1-phosphate uridylyltransferase